MSHEGLNRPRDTHVQLPTPQTCTAGCTNFDALFEANKVRVAAAYEKREAHFTAKLGIRLNHGLTEEMTPTTVGQLWFNRS